MQVVGAPKKSFTQPPWATDPDIMMGVDTEEMNAMRASRVATAPMGSVPSTARSSQAARSDSRASSQAARSDSRASSVTSTVLHGLEAQVAQEQALRLSVSKEVAELRQLLSVRFYRALVAAQGSIIALEMTRGSADPGLEAAAT